MRNFGLEIIVHILFWVGTGSLIVSGFSIQLHEIEVINGVETESIVRSNGLIYQLLLCIVLSMLSFYVNAQLIIKYNQNANRKIWTSLLVFAITLILIYFLTDFQVIKNSLPVPKEIAFGVAVFYFSLSIAYGLVKHSIKNQQRHQRLILDKKQAELALLRNQLQPHFLFNALNNLMAMVNRSENPKLVSSFDKISQLLRFVIEDNKAEKIPILKEIEFLKNYIDLQMLRFEEGEVNVQFNMEGDNNEQKIEPGLFIPFVENAFKYGTEPENLSKIDIQFDLSQADSIQFEIKNKMMMSNTNSIGTGIETTKKRLDLIYPDKYKLKISNANEFIVQLTISTQ